MKNILKELWYGNICPFEDYYSNTREMRELSKLIANDRDRISQNLSEEGEKIFERYSENVLELECLTKEALFDYAFSLGVRLAVACLL